MIPEPELAEWVRLGKPRVSTWRRLCNLLNCQPLDAKMRWQQLVDNGDIVLTVQHRVSYIRKSVIATSQIDTMSETAEVEKMYDLTPVQKEDLKGLMQSGMSLSTACEMMGLDYFAMESALSITMGVHGSWPISDHELNFENKGINIFRVPKRKFKRKFRSKGDPRD